MTTTRRRVSMRWTESVRESSRMRQLLNCGQLDAVVVTCCDALHVDVDVLDAPCAHAMDCCLRAIAMRSRMRGRLAFKLSTADPRAPSCPPMYHGQLTLIYDAIVSVIQHHFARRAHDARASKWCSWPCSIARRGDETPAMGRGTATRGGRRTGRQQRAAQRQWLVPASENVA